MRRRCAAGLAALLVIASQLTGCFIAAPIAAAGMLARSRLKQGGSLPLRSRAAQSRQQPNVKPRTTIDANALTVTTLTALPGPATSTAAVADAGGYAAFAAFALDQHRLGLAGARASVVLAPDSTLSAPTVVPCAGQPSAVVVDVALAGDGPPLGVAVQQLRAGGVAVLWAADAADDAPGVRRALAANGIDLASDRVLVATSAARKQLVRQYAALDHCIVAIAGARRGDMDELYDYLKDATAAYRIDVLWNAGWFLMPRTAKDAHALDAR